MPPKATLTHDAPRRTAAWTFAAGSIVVGVLVLGIKLLAWRLTGSVALYSDAIESIVNVVAAAAALVAIRIAARPADASHPFGHGKAEYLSAVAEGVLIVIAALAILQEAALALRAPRPLDAPWLGLAASGFASLLNGGWALVLMRQGRRLRSAALIADGHHLMSDVVTSSGVIVGVVLAAATGLAWLDPAIALVVGGYVVWAGWRVVRRSVDGLMDAAADTALTDRIRATIGATLDGARAAGIGPVSCHGLRARESGHQAFVEFTLVVPGGMTVAASHHLCDGIEAAIAAELPQVRVLIHVEPGPAADATGR